MRTLYRNGRLHTRVIRGLSALLVEDGKIIDLVGDDTVADTAADLATNRVVDLGGALVTPAFVDAHVHTTATGVSLAGLDLSAATSLRAALDLVEHAARRGRGRPVLGGGWDESAWPEGRPPTATELDRAGYGGAVYLARVDAHSAVVSSQLLAGVRELAGFRADGWVTRAAHDAARTVAQQALRGDTTRLQRIALRHAASLGIASVHEMAGPAISSADDLAALLALAAAEPLPEVIGYWGELFGIDTARQLGAVGAAGDLFCDGSLGSHTAALHEPYLDQPDTTGMLRFDTDDVTEHIVRCQQAGLQAGFHAIGDAAVDQVITAAERATGRLGRSAVRHRIEHAEFVSDPARLAASGLHASLQPMFDATWGGTSGMYADRLGTARAGRLNRFADLAAAGVPLAFGSDAPVTALGPWAAVGAAVHPHDTGSGIDTVTAFAAHTDGGRRAAGQPAIALERGAPATFAVWDVTDVRDSMLPELHPDAELPRCLATVRDGLVIHDGGELGLAADPGVR